MCIEYLIKWIIYTRDDEHTTNIWWNDYGLIERLSSGSDLCDDDDAYETP